MSDKKFVYIYIISDRSQKDEMEKLLYTAGGAMMNCVYGRGYYESRNLFDYFGFSEKRGRVVVNGIIEREKAIELIQKLNEEYSFKKAGTGIAFTLPIEKIAY